MILAGDVGGTKILLEVGESRSGRFESAFARRYSAENVVNFVDVMKTFLEEGEKEKPARARITAGALGVAGPSQGNKIKMTHRPWAVDGDAIASRCRIPKFFVVNDLAAAAAGIAALTPKEMLTVQPGKALPEEPRVVLGVGTGLGVAYLIPHGKRVKVVPGEGGHIAFGPETPEQAELWRALFEAKGRVEVEDVVSGRGLANIYEFMARQSNSAIGGHERADPAWVTQNAIEAKDPVFESDRCLLA